MGQYHLVVLTPAPSIAIPELPRQYDLIRVVSLCPAVITSGFLEYLVEVTTDTKVNDKLIPYVVDVGANYPQAKPSCMNPRVPPQPHTEALTAYLMDAISIG